MKRKLPAAAVEDCSHCPAFVPNTGATVRASGFFAVPSRLAAQVTDGIRNAVVTTFGKGTFIIRGPQDGSVHVCPLRAYDVRHVPADPPPDRNLPADQTDRRGPIEACQDQPVRVARNGFQKQTRHA